MPFKWTSKSKSFCAILISIATILLCCITVFYKYQQQIASLKSRIRAYQKHLNISNVFLFLGLIYIATGVNFIYMYKMYINVYCMDIDCKKILFTHFG